MLCSFTFHLCHEQQHWTAIDCQHKCWMRRGACHTSKSGKAGVVGLPVCWRTCSLGNTVFIHICVKTDSINTGDLYPLKGFFVIRYFKLHFLRSATIKFNITAHLWCCFLLVEACTGKIFYAIISSYMSIVVSVRAVLFGGWLLNQHLCAHDH